MCTHCNWSEYLLSLLGPQAASPAFSQMLPAGLSAPGPVPDPGDLEKRAPSTIQRHCGDFPGRTPPDLTEGKAVGEARWILSVAQGPRVSLRGGLLVASQLDFFYLESQPMHPEGKGA